MCEVQHNTPTENRTEIVSIFNSDTSQIQRVFSKNTLLISLILLKC